MIDSRSTGSCTTAADDFEVEFLLVAEIEESGRVTALVYFDPEALIEAVDELDERYFVGEGVAVASLHRVNFRSFAAANARDWDAYRDTYSPDLVCTDRRQIGWPTLDRADLVATIREYTELVPDLILLPRKVEIRGPAALFTVDASGTTPDGGTAQWLLYTVSIVTPTGISSPEMFDEDDYAAALRPLRRAGRGRTHRDPNAVRARTTRRRSWRGPGS